MNHVNHRIVLVVAIVVGFPALPSCTRTAPDSVREPPAHAAESSSAAADAAFVADPGVLRESWDIYLLQGKRIGYGRTTVRRGTESGRELLLIESTSHMATKRDGQTSTQDISTKSVETPNGRLVRFTSEVCLGPNPIKTSGIVRGDQLGVDVVGPGAANANRSSMPWSSDIEGPLGMEQSLLRQPMRPSERRSVRIVMPELAGVAIATIQLSAKQVESVQIAGQTRDLLRIETVTQLSGGQNIDGVVWSDASGEVLKNVAAGLEQYRATKAEAIKDADVAQVDLLTSMLVKVDPPLSDPHHAKRLRYRVHLEGGDPAKVFASGPSQSVTSIDRNTADVTVYAIRPDAHEGSPDATEERPTPDDLSPNSFVQSDDPTIVKDAQFAKNGQTDPWHIALALERYVHGEVRSKNFSQAFASAAEVAKSREGDCTEHAVFLAALARASGIPARVAIGLVYVKSNASFGYHMWTEVYIDGRWIPLDGTLALGGIGAGHLKIADSNLKAASAYAAFLPVVQILGRLRIDPIGDAGATGQR